MALHFFGQMIMDEPRKLLCEAEINGERIVYDACRHNTTLEQAKEDYKRLNFEYIGSGNIAYYDGVRNEHPYTIHFFKRKNAG